MSKVLTFEHRGVRCGIPANRAEVAASRGDARAESVPLWGHRSSSSGSPTHSVQVATATGRIWIDCSEPRLVSLSRDDLVKASELLRHVTGVGHVVAVARTPAGATWLVDPERIEPDRG